MAKQLGVDFEFYSFVMQSREQEIKKDFGKHIIETYERKFLRMTWEQIYDYIKTLPNNKEKQKMTDYYENKIIGYNSNGTRIKAFDILNKDENKNKC